MQYVMRKVHHGFFDAAIHVSRSNWSLSREISACSDVTVGNVVGPLKFQFRRVAVPARVDFSKNLPL